MSPEHRRIVRPLQGVRWRTVVAAGAAVLILGGVGGLALAKRDDGAAKADAPTPVGTATARPLGATGGVRGDGVFEREREVPLAFRTVGVMTRLLVDEGDRVAPGQLLASLDPVALDATAEAAAIDLDRARRDLDRNKALHDKGFVSAARLEDRRAALAAAEARSRGAAFDRRYARLVAPAGGTIVSRPGEAGQVVQPGQAVLVMTDDASRLVLRAPVTDRDAARVRVGDAAMVTVPALGRTLSGKVMRIAERADSRTGAVDIEIAVADDPALRPGLLASVEVAVGGAAPDTGLTAVPPGALLEIDGKRAFVYRLQAGRARRTAVAFEGFRDGLAVVRGLPAGAVVITEGAGFIRDGARVSAGR